MKTKRIADYALDASAAPSRRTRRAQRSSAPAVPAHTALSARVIFDGSYITPYGTLLPLPCVMYFASYERSGAPGGCVREPAMGGVYLLAHCVKTYVTFFRYITCTNLRVCQFQKQII